MDQLAAPDIDELSRRWVCRSLHLLGPCLNCDAGDDEQAEDGEDPKAGSKQPSPDRACVGVRRIGHWRDRRARQTIR
jgi:hypothetical protein